MPFCENAAIQQRSFSVDKGTATTAIVLSSRGCVAGAEIMRVAQCHGVH